MLSLSASAPGKLVIAGEYAVLDGAPAVVMAVDRRASAAVAAPSAGRNAPVPDLLRAVREELRIDAAAAAPALDTSAFFATDRAGRQRKLGLGSSAALTAALCRLLLPPETSREMLLGTALAAHRRFQSGQGSGVDVAASVTGGILAYRMHGTAVEPLRWPPPLAWSAWWSGETASTTASLGRLAQSGTSSARVALADAADAVATAWARAPHRAVLAALAHYVDALLDFDVYHRLDIFAAGHGALVARARDMGAVYKPCGAGGGDIGIAIADDGVVLRAFAQTAEEHGFRRLDLSIDPAGAQLHGRAP